MDQFDNMDDVKRRHKEPTMSKLITRQLRHAADILHDVYTDSADIEPQRSDYGSEVTWLEAVAMHHELREALNGLRRDVQKAFDKERVLANHAREMTVKP